MYRKHKQMWCLGLGAIPKMRSSVQGNGLKLGKFLNAKHSSPMHLDGRCPLPESIKMSTKEPYVYFPPTSRCWGLDPGSCVCWKSTLPWSCILGAVCLTKYNLHSCFQKNRPQSWPYFLHRILSFFRGLFYKVEIALIPALWLIVNIK